MSCASSDSATSSARKRSRNANFTVADRRLLLIICNERKNVIEDRRTDVQTNESKNKAWEEIANWFNDRTSGTTRTVDGLRIKYNNIKAELRKLDRSQEWRHTGGEPPPSSQIVELMDEEKELLLTLVKGVDGLAATSGDAHVEIENGLAVSAIVKEEFNESSLGEFIDVNSRWDDVGPRTLQTADSEELRVPSRVGNTDSGTEEERHSSEGDPPSTSLPAATVHGATRSFNWPTDTPIASAPTTVPNSSSRRRHLFQKKRTRAFARRKFEELAEARLRLIKMKEDTEKLLNQEAEVRLNAARDIAELQIANERARLQTAECLLRIRLMEEQELMKTIGGTRFQPTL